MQIGGVTIDTPVMNAACSVAKTMSDVVALSKTGIGAVLIGSVTLLPRTINPGLNFEADEYYALNSFGMPNKGMEYYKKHLPDMVKVIHQSGKKAVLSIAGFSVDDYRKLATLGEMVDLLELNLGCPNVKDLVSHSEIISFNPVLIEQILIEVRKATETPLMVKLSPYSNPQQLSVIAEVLSRQQVAAVVTSNTFANGVFKQGTANADAMYAGISGKALMPIALGQVSQFRSLLPKTIKVVGVGGIERSSDVRTYLQAGADLVQAATLIVRDGHAAIDRLFR